MFGFPGHAVTGQDLVEAIAKASGRRAQGQHINWLMMRTVGSIWTMGRELSEIGYLWQVPHRIDGTKLPPRSATCRTRRSIIAVAHSLRELGAIA